jgi:hypothetical protein
MGAKSTPTTKTTRQCLDWPAQIPARGGRKRCLDCQARVAQKTPKGASCCSAGDKLLAGRRPTVGAAVAKAHLVISTCTNSTEATIQLARLFADDFDTETFGLTAAPRIGPPLAISQETKRR